jgi:hypothetical protein
MTAFKKKPFDIKEQLLKAKIDYRLIPRDSRTIEDDTIRYVSDLLYRNPNNHINHRRLYRELNDFKEKKALLESKLHKASLMRRYLKDAVSSLRVSIKVLEFLINKAT